VSRRHPALVNAELVLQLEDERQQAKRRWSESEGSRASRRLYRDVMLAPKLSLCEALCQGEAVPIELLDQEQVKRFGLR
jgi:hypothetical protein